MSNHTTPPAGNPTHRVWNWPHRIERWAKIFVGYVIAPFITFFILILMTGVIGVGALRTRLASINPGERHGGNGRKGVPPTSRDENLKGREGAQKNRKTAQLVAKNPVRSKIRQARSIVGAEICKVANDHFQSDLGMCRSAAAIEALLEEPKFRSGLSKRGREMVLRHLANVGANASQTSDVLVHLGLRWLYQSPLSRRIIALHSRQDGEQTIWSHQAESVVCFEAWRGRPMLEKTSGRPKLQLFAYFDINGQLISTYIPPPKRFL